MCGIVGYVGDRSAQEVVVEGLRRLEYRGYDSAGVALVDSGRVELRLEPVNLREVATDTLALLESKWAPKGLAMELAIPAELPDVSGDLIRLQQIF